jgi:transcription termination/antitermination protein NusG
MDFKDCHDQWLVLHVRANFEFTAAYLLQNKGYQGFVPSYDSTENRRRGTKAPLFRGYIFCKYNQHLNSSIVSTPGVMGILKSAGQVATIDVSTIEMLRKVQTSCVNPKPSSDFCLGARVRVLSGPFVGTEGSLVRQKSKCRLVLAVHTINRFVSIEVDASTVQEV